MLSPTAIGSKRVVFQVNNIVAFEKWSVVQHYGKVFHMNTLRDQGNVDSFGVGSLEMFSKVALDNTPANVRVRDLDPASDSHPRVIYERRVMIVPKPDSLESLRAYLHECAHFALHETYLIEFQAETWALEKMQAAGLTLSEEFILESRSKIAYSIRCAVKNKIGRLDRQAFEFASPCFDDSEKSEFGALTQQG
jgi:hypothetical protein